MSQAAVHEPELLELVKLIELAKQKTATSSGPEEESINPGPFHTAAVCAAVAEAAFSYYSQRQECHLRGGVPTAKVPGPRTGRVTKRGWNAQQGPSGGRTHLGAFSLSHLPLSAQRKET